jgi:hypothetical protein
LQDVKLNIQQMWAINTKLQIQVREKEKKLIYFSLTLKRFSISVNITLTRYKIIVKSNIRILRIQLNLKLR